MDYKNKLEGGIQQVSQDMKRPRIKSEVPNCTVAVLSDSSDASPLPQFGESSAEAFSK